MRYQSTIQIILIGISLLVIFLVLQPKLTDIKAAETETASYDEAIQKADIYNQSIQALLDQTNSIPQFNIDQLYTYLPEDIDSLLVAKDIEVIITSNGAILNSIAENQPSIIDTQTFSENEAAMNASGVFTDSASNANNKQYVAQSFQVQFVTTYSNMKDILRDFERNAYPLRLVGFSYDADNDSDLQTFSLNLETYAFGEGIISGDGAKR